MRFEIFMLRNLIRRNSRKCTTAFKNAIQKCIGEVSENKCLDLELLNILSGYFFKIPRGRRKRNSSRNSRKKNCIALQNETQ